METGEDTRALVALLDWYRAMGADAAVADVPVDWLARGQVPPGHGFVLPKVSAATTASDVGAPREPGRAPGRPPLQQATGGSQGAVTRHPDAQSAPATPPPRAARPPLPGRSSAAEAPSRSAAMAGAALAAPDAATRSAREAARAATSLSELEAALAGFDGCGLKATAKSLCFARGAARARVMVIGEAPGAEEDRSGKPFVGPAGQLLDLMLAAIGLTEAEVHITNSVYWRPPGNRTPTPQETTVCRPFLERQIELVAPEIVVAMGGAAAKQVLDVVDGIMKVRGTWREAAFGGHRTAAIATLHPAYLLRTPAAKRLAWRDLLAVRARLDAVT